MTLLKRMLLSLITVTSLVAFVGLFFLNVPSAHASASIPLATGNVGPALFNGGNCAGWRRLSDGVAITPSNGFTPCNSAIWDDHGLTQGRTCDVFVFIPREGTATITYGVFDSLGNRIGTPTVNQNNFFGWVGLGSFTDIHHIQISDNDGQTGNTIGVQATAQSMSYNCP
jgi:hypothetical protein